MRRVPDRHTVRVQVRRDIRRPEHARIGRVGRRRGGPEGGGGEPDYLVKEDEARAAFHSPFGHGGFGSGSTALKRSWQNLVPSESPHGSELSLENLQQQPVA